MDKGPFLFWRVVSGYKLFSWVDRADFGKTVTTDRQPDNKLIRVASLQLLCIFEGQPKKSIYSYNRIKKKIRKQILKLFMIFNQL